MEIELSDVSSESIEVHYLKMMEKPERFLADTQLELMLLDKPVGVNYYLDVYQAVGLAHHWLDRLVMDPRELDGLINRSNVDIFLIFKEDDPCGFVEYEIKDGHVEILYFGLLREFLGQGLGRSCLRIVVDRAWSYGPDWIQLNTCVLDNARALRLYQSVGFEIYKTCFEQRKVLS